MDVARAARRKVRDDPVAAMAPYLDVPLPSTGPSVAPPSIPAPAVSQKRSPPSTSSSSDSDSDSDSESDSDDSRRKKKRRHKSKKHKKGTKKHKKDTKKHKKHHRDKGGGPVADGGRKDSDADKAAALVGARGH